MRVLVTGGAGFIGSHVVDALVARGAAVVCIDSLDSAVHAGPPSYLNPAAEYRFVDLRSWSPEPADGRIEAVVHLAALGGVARAAREPANLVSANAGGTARLVEAISDWPCLRRVVVASSFSVYGEAYRYQCDHCGTVTDGKRWADDLDRGRYEVTCRVCGGPTQVLPLTELAEPAPLELYGASKLMQELCFRGFTTCPVHVLRQSSVYGSRLRLDDGEATIIARIAGWVRAGQPPRLLEDGLQIRDWVHVDDAVGAMMALVDEVPAPPVINVCTGIKTTLGDACRHIADALSSGIQPEVVGGYRPGDMRHCLGDPSALIELLGREPRSLASAVHQAFSDQPAARSGR